MRKRFGALATILLLAGCGGASQSGPEPTATSALAPALFEGVTHFDAFDRANTQPGRVSDGPQGQKYDIYSSYLLDPDVVSRIRNRRFYTPPTTANVATASYLLTQTPGAIKRIGAVLEYNENAEAPVGPNGYVWTLIVANSRYRFTDDMIHFTGTHNSWKLETWTPSGARRTLAEGRFPALAYGTVGRIDLRLDGDEVTVNAPGSAPQVVKDPELARYTNSHIAVVEHYIPGRTLNIQQYRAIYLEVEGAPALDPSAFALAP